MNSGFIVINSDVGVLEIVLFFHILGKETNWLIFFSGVGQPPTSMTCVALQELFEPRLVGYAKSSTVANPHSYRDFYHVATTMIDHPGLGMIYIYHLFMVTTGGWCKWHGLRLFYPHYPGWGLRSHDICIPMTWDGWSSTHVMSTPD